MLLAGISCQNGSSPAAVTLQPTITTEPAQAPSVGQSRQNPFTAHSVADLPSWQVAILEQIRGEPAETLVLNANMFNNPAPEGFEYLLLNLSLLKKATATETTSLQMGLTGANHRLYYSFIQSAVAPEPRLTNLNDLPVGKQKTGWKTFLVGENEGGLLLYLYEGGSQQKHPFYLQLEEGTTYSTSTVLPPVTETETGKVPAQPAPFGQTIYTARWQIQLKQMLTGKPAWQLLQESNHTPEPAPDGMNYLLVKLYVRNIGDDETYPPRINRWQFAVLVDGVRYEPPTNITEPHPKLRDLALYPGGDMEGWILLQMPALAKNPILTFESVGHIPQTNHLLLPTHHRTLTLCGRFNEVPSTAPTIPAPR